jgi:hypothetical protein
MTSCYHYSLQKVQASCANKYTNFLTIMLVQHSVSTTCATHKGIAQIMTYGQHKTNLRRTKCWCYSKRLHINVEVYHQHHNDFMEMGLHKRIDEHKLAIVSCTVDCFWWLVGRHEFIGMLRIICGDPGDKGIDNRARQLSTPEAR